MAELTIKEIEELIERLEQEAEQPTYYPDVVCIDGAKVQAATALRHLLNERKWRPIWTPEQVSNLHAWQRADHVHPFTCPHRDDHLVIDGDKGILIPTVRGWICQFCDYTQDWAHSSMLSGPHNMPLPLPPSPEENGDV